MAFRAAFSFSSSAVSSSTSFDRREDNDGIEGEFKWCALKLCGGVPGRVLGLILLNLNLKNRLSEVGGGVAEFGGDNISVEGREEYSVELERSSDVRWVPGSPPPSRTLVRRQPTSFDWPESDLFRASSSISLLAMTSCRLDLVTLSWTSSSACALYASFSREDYKASKKKGLSIRKSCNKSISIETNNKRERKGLTNCTTLSMTIVKAERRSSSCPCECTLRASWSSSSICENRGCEEDLCCVAFKSVERRGVALGLFDCSFEGKCNISISGYW